MDWDEWLQVSEFGSVDVQALMEIERYSHVMHISSTVTGRLKAGLDAWDALRAALPAGTVSGAPKVNFLPHATCLTSFAPLQNCKHAVRLSSGGCVWLRRQPPLGD